MENAVIHHGVWYTLASTLTFTTDFLRLAVSRIWSTHILFEWRFELRSGGVGQLRKHRWLIYERWISRVGVGGDVNANGFREKDRFIVFEFRTDRSWWLSQRRIFNYGNYVLAYYDDDDHIPLLDLPARMRSFSKGDKPIIFSIRISCYYSVDHVILKYVDLVALINTLRNVLNIEL